MFQFSRHCVFGWCPMAGVGLDIYIYIYNNEIQEERFNNNIFVYVDDLVLMSHQKFGNECIATRGCSTM